MADRDREILPTLIRPVLRFVIGLVVILIIRAVVAALPMIRDATISGFRLTPLQIALAVVDTIIIVVLLNFGREMGNSLRFAIKSFPEVGSIATLIVGLIAVSIAYSSYRNFGFLLPLSIRWIYSVLFVVLAAIPLYFLIMTVYRNIDKLTDLSVKKIQTATEKSTICSGCGAKMAVDVQFCANCGQQAGKEEVANEPAKCPECGVVVEEDAAFCAECGSRIEVPVAAC